jgi:hypothetical protein
MAVRSGDHLQRRHEGSLYSDLLAATLRSNREVEVFVLQMARQNFWYPPTHPASFMAVIKFGILRRRVHTLGGETAAARDHVAVSGLISLRRVVI